MSVNITMQTNHNHSLLKYVLTSTRTTVTFNINVNEDRPQKMEYTRQKSYLTFCSMSSFNNLQIKYTCTREKYSEFAQKLIPFMDGIKYFYTKIIFKIVVNVSFCHAISSFYNSSAFNFLGRMEELDCSSEFHCEQLVSSGIITSNCGTNQCAFYYVQDHLVVLGVC